jgi:hypothetical protein
MVKDRPEPIVWFEDEEQISKEDFGPMNKGVIHKL